MRRPRYKAGFVDPLSIFVIVFLVITLAVGAAVTTNRNFSLNIAEKAAESNEGQAGYLPPNTCIPNCSGKTCGDDGCGKSCGTCTNPLTCSAGKCIAPAVVPTAAPPAVPGTPGYDLDTAINSANNIPGTPGYDCRKGGCPPGSGPVSGYYESNGKYYAIGGTGNDPSRYNEGPSLSVADKKIASNDCRIAGGTYVADIDLCYKSETSITKEKTDHGFITNYTTIIRNLDTGFIIDADTLSTINKTTTRTERDEDLSGHGLNTQTIYNTTINLNTGEVLNNNIRTISVTPQPVAFGVTNRFTQFSSKEQCQQNRTPGTRGYNECSSFSTDEESLKSVFNTLDKITFGTFSNYAESYSPDQVKITWEEAGYSSLKECQQDMFNKGKNYHASLACSQYITTKEQLSSSIQLGTVITAEAALVTTGFGYGSGVLTGAQALTNALAISTVYQTGTAASTCVENPGSSQCTEETIYAAISLINVGTAANLTNAIRSGVQTTITGAKAVNAVVNVANVGVDIYDASKVCTGENFSGFGCALGVGATLLDVGGGTLDILDVIGDVNLTNVNLGNLTNEVAGFPSDIAPPNVTTIIDTLPPSNTIFDLTEAVVPNTAFTDFDNVDNVIADITLTQVTDVPNAEALVDLAQASPDEVLANLNHNFQTDNGISKIQEAVDDKANLFETVIVNPIKNILGDPIPKTLDTPLSKLSDAEIDNLIAKSPDYIPPTTAQDITNYYLSNYTKDNQEFIKYTAGLNFEVYGFKYEGTEYVVKITKGRGVLPENVGNRTIDGDRLITKQGLLDALLPTTFVTLPDGSRVGVQKFAEGDSRYVPDETIDLLKDHGLGVIDPKNNIVNTPSGPKIIDSEFFFSIEDRIKDVAKNPKLANAYSLWFDPPATPIQKVKNFFDDLFTSQKPTDIPDLVPDPPNIVDDLLSDLGLGDYAAKEIGDKIFVSEYGIESAISKKFPDSFVTWVTIFDPEHVSESQALGFLWKNLPGGDRMTDQISKLPEFFGSSNVDVNVLLHSYHDPRLPGGYPAEVVAFNGSDYTASQFGELLKSHGVSPESVSKVKLIVCNAGVCPATGPSFAQTVANITNVQVEAPVGFAQTGVTQAGSSLGPVLVYRNRTILPDGTSQYIDLVPQDEAFVTFTPQSE